MCRTEYSAPQYLFICWSPFIPLDSETLEEQNLEVGHSNFGTKNESPRVHELMEQSLLLSISSLWHMGWRHTKNRRHKGIKNLEEFQLPSFRFWYHLLPDM